MTMTDAAIVLKRSPVTDEIGPCEGCGTLAADRFAYAKFMGRPFWVLAGCTGCGYISVIASSPFPDGEFEMLPTSHKDEFTKAVAAIRSRES